MDQTIFHGPLLELNLREYYQNSQGLEEKSSLIKTGGYDPTQYEKSILQVMVKM
jgi:hypothetical protein